MGFRFQKVQGLGDAAKVFILVRNVSAATVSAHIPVEWDVTVATDGHAVTAAKSGSLAGLFAGITDASMTDSAYGDIQVYGFRASAYVSRASAGDVPGKWLQPVSGIFDSGVTMSAATTSGHTFVTLLETITASAAYSSSAQIYLHSVFIRSM